VRIRPTVSAFRLSCLALLILPLPEPLFSFTLADSSGNEAVSQRTADETIEVSATDEDKLRALLEGNQIIAFMRDRRSVAGKVQNVHSGTLRLQLPSAGPVPSHIDVPVGDLSELYLTDRKGKWRVTMPILLAGVSFLTAGFFIEEDGRNTWSLYTLPLAGAATGYFIGHQMDQQQVRVLIR
jgi:hypothetical protein